MTLLHNRCLMIVTAAAASLLMAACAASPSTPESTPIPGAPDVEITVTCTEENAVVFELHNAGDPIPSEGWAYAVRNEDGEIVEQGGTSLGTDESEVIVMDDAGPYTLIITDGGIEQIGDCDS